MERIVLLLLSVAGLLVVAYIAYVKHNKRELLCPLRGTCNAVIYSKYAKFLGIDLTVFGLVYYGFLVLGYVSLILLPGVIPAVVEFLVLGASVTGFLFSLYLVAIQGIVLKRWCAWCVASAFITAAIAGVSLGVTELNVLLFLEQYRGVVVLLHALAAAVGVGATSVTDVSFTRYLRDFRIDQLESANMRMYSQIIWVALGVLIVTGIGLYLPEMARLNQSAKFLVKVIAVGVITINGVVLNLYVTPRLTKMSFAAYKKDLPAGFARARSVMLASGAISIVSWYLVFVLGSIRSIPVSFPVGLIVYMSLLVAAVLGSVLYERFLMQKAQKR